MKRWGWMLAALLAACAPDRAAMYCAAPSGDGPGTRFPICTSNANCGPNGQCNLPATSRPRCTHGGECVAPEERHPAGTCAVRCASDSACPADQHCDRYGFCDPIVCPRS